MGKSRFSATTNKPRKGVARLIGWFVRATSIAAIIICTVLLLWAFESRKAPALGIWHTSPLTSEFTARDATPQSTLEDYLDQEDRLFRELQVKIYDKIPPTAEMTVSRYRAGGPQDPEQLPRNWNRTFELVPESIVGGALLLHGLSDSPYSLRRIGEILYEKGFYVLGLRLPAHGTTPEALTEASWLDWVAASRIGARHVRQRIGPDKPFMMAGYSNGGALTVKYNLDALSDSDLPPADRILLFSPEIGITPVSAISNWHKLFSFIPYFAQSEWLSIQPEYDPFKYNSFPKNAGQQAYEITAALQKQVQEAKKAGILTKFPPVTTFLSWIDSTVETSMTIDRFYAQLENQGNELVIFDVDRSALVIPFYPSNDAAKIDDLKNRSDLPFRLTVITNVAPDSRSVAEQTKTPRSQSADVKDLNMTWPPGVFSLSHVAIPFSSDDPIYGSVENPNAPYQGLPFGRLQPRGETHYLTAPLSQLMRLRHNPFFPYVAQRVLTMIDQVLGRSPESTPES
jgi:alpha-beta hydrolase superfamily lysophospholipase